MSRIAVATGGLRRERAWSACLPSGELLDDLLAQNAGRSSGLRELVEAHASTWTSSSTQVPPAFSMSVLSDGHEVIVRPFEDIGLDERPRPVADHADRFLLLRITRASKATAPSSVRKKSGFATPPVSTSPS